MIRSGRTKIEIDAKTGDSKVTLPKPVPPESVGNSGGLSSLRPPPWRSIASLAAWGALILGGGATGIGGVAGLAIGARKALQLWRSGRPVSAAVLAARTAGETRDSVQRVHVDVSALAAYLRPHLGGDKVATEPAQVTTERVIEKVVPVEKIVEVPVDRVVEKDRPIIVDRERVGDTRYVPFPESNIDLLLLLDAIDDYKNQYPGSGAPQVIHSFWKQRRSAGVRPQNRSLPDA